MPLNNLSIVDFQFLFSSPLSLDCFLHISLVASIFFWDESTKSQATLIPMLSFFSMADLRLLFASDNVLVVATWSYSSKSFSLFSANTSFSSSFCFDFIICSFHFSSSSFNFLLLTASSFNSRSIFNLFTSSAIPLIIAFVTTTFPTPPQA